MKTATTVATVLGMLAGSGQAIAGVSRLPYDFVEFGYAQVEFDDANVDADGFGIGFSAEVGSQVVLTGGYAAVETDEFTEPLLFGADTTLKATSYSLGLGFHQALSPRVDLVPSVAVVMADIEIEGDSASAEDDDTGFALGLDLRALVSPALEISGGLNYVDIFEDDNTSLDVGLMFYPAGGLGLGVGYGIDDDADTLSFSARLNF